MLGEISELVIHPIKSLGRVSVAEARVVETGLEFDRHWMLVEPDGSFITQREDPSLTAFKLKATEGGFDVSIANERMKGSCLLETSRGDHARVLKSVRVWRDEFEAELVSPALDEFFSEALGRDCHLVEMPSTHPRSMNPDFGASAVSFGDAMPILVLSEASMADLNGRLEHQVPHNRFRANLILRGLTAYAEDEIESISIGDVLLKSTKRCGRCLVTCTDQETGARGTEPLRTLAAFRTFGNNACMGMYFYPQQTGVVRVGNSVTYR